ncbi:MAG: iron chaperone [Candidatus Kapaibacterium sp.]
MKAPAKDIDAYIALQPERVQIALEKLRKTILSVAPDAKEVISYGMPAFKYHGMLAGFAGWKNHIGFYPWNSRTVTEFKDELNEYETSKGAIQFPLEKPIPVALVKKIIKARMKGNIAKESARKIVQKKSKKKR